jgi:hypothetical protein
MGRCLAGGCNELLIMRCPDRLCLDCAVRRLGLDHQRSQSVSLTTARKISSTSRAAIAALTITGPLFFADPLFFVPDTQAFNDIGRRRYARRRLPSDWGHSHSTG